MITPVGTAHEGLLWAQHTCRNWFMAVEVTLGGMSVLQWGSWSGCWWMVPRAKVQHFMMEFSSLYHYATNVSVYMGNILENNGTSVL